MLRLFHGCIVALVTVSATSGCMTWRSTKSAPSYETIGANPTYDTVCAEKHHRTAVRILEACVVGNPGDYADAEDHLQKALVADVTYGPAHNSLGILYMFQRNFYLAAWEFEYAARLMPERVEPVYNLGKLYEEAERVDLAIEYYEQALALSPRDPAVTASLASARLKNGESVDDVRPLLEAIIFADSRREWADWAQDHLGRHPIPVVSPASSTAPRSSVPSSYPRMLDDSAPRDGDRRRVEPPPDPSDEGPGLYLPRRDEAQAPPEPSEPPPPAAPLPDDTLDPASR